MTVTPEISVDRILRALADPSRKAIVERLSRAPDSVSRLATPLGVTVTAVAQHLQVLEDAGLVRTEKIGRVRTCSLETKGFQPLEQWIRERRSLWEMRFDQLGDFLTEEDEP